MEPVTEPPARITRLSSDLILHSRFPSFEMSIPASLAALVLPAKIAGVSFGALLSG